MSSRGEFSSRLGFILAAAGSAVGLGNIWGFPTKVAENGGAAFVVMYVVLAFLLAYPVLMAEFVIGRATRANMVHALKRITGSRLGSSVGIVGIITVSLILSFYAIVGGWMIAHGLDSLVAVTNLGIDSTWLIEQSQSRDIIFLLMFVTLTAGIVIGGVSSGIEKWSVRLMPTLFVIVVGLIIYVSSQAGAAEGWKAYLLPDFSRALEPELMIDAMGQAFFSMSLGVGTMLIYGSYVSKSENLPQLGASVALLDIAVAFLAGMLIIPAMYVALHNGVEIFDDSGALISGGSLIFAVLPALFETMGSAGVFVSLLFFCLMTVAALTSSISMLEVPVAFGVENFNIGRRKTVVMVTAIIFTASATIAANFERLFEFVVSLTTEYSQPLLGLMLCVFVGWCWNRGAILAELKQGDSGIEGRLFWKIWPWYIKYVCPLIIAFMFYRLF